MHPVTPTPTFFHQKVYIQPPGIGAQGIPVYEPRAEQQSELVSQFHEDTISLAQSSDLKVKGNYECGPSKPVKIGKPKRKMVVYDVQLTDTLDRICLQFDVPKDAIRQANDFSGDEVYMFKQLKIPFSSKIEILTFRGRAGEYQPDEPGRGAETQAEIRGGGNEYHPDRDV